MPSRLAPSIALAALVAVVGFDVAPSRAQSPRPADVDAATRRPYDGLLDRPELRAVVERQIERDAASLVSRLSDSDPAVRARAAFALGSVQDEAAVPALLEALGDPDSRVRSDAAFALGQSADSAAAGAMLDALVDEPSETVRAELLTALGKTGGRASLDRLASLDVESGDRVAWVGAIARYGLRGVHAPAAVDRVIRLLAADDLATRSRAGYALARPADPAPWVERANEVRTFLDAIPILGPPAAVSAPSSLPEMRLVTALGRLDDPVDDARLIERLRGSGDWRTRVAAARALASRAADPAVGRALLSVLSDPSPHVAIAAGAALSAPDSLPDDTVTEIARIAGLDRSRDWRVSTALLPALAKNGVDSFIILYLMGLDREGEIPEARAHALEALGHGSTAPGFLVLEHEAGWEDPRVAAAAVEGLATRWTRGIVDSLASAERYYRAFVSAVREGELPEIATAAPVLTDSAFVAMGSIAALTDARERLDPSTDGEAIEAVREALEATGASVPGRVLDEPPVPVVDWAALADLGPRPRLVLETARGTVAIEMDTGQAPLTVQTIAGFARAGSYDGVPFHRVVPNFVVQGGDFARGDGWGGPGFSIVSEFTRAPYGTGAVGMASAGKDTEGSQWFVTHSPQPHLDGRYTAFGVVVEGRDVVDRLLEGDRITRARVEPDRPD